MGGGSPKAADTVGAAKEQGEQARKLNEAQTYANRPNQSNPWGSTSWGNTPVWDSATGQYVNTWTQTETLNPKLQEQVDANMNINSGRANLAQGMMGRVWEDQQNPFDFDAYGDVIQYDPAEARQRAEDNAYARSTARLDPQFNSERAATETRLRNQGLAAGDQAYDSAMNNFQTGRNDAYEMARLGATGEGRDESYLGMTQNQLANELRKQGMSEGLFERGFSLQEMERMLAGTGVQGGPPTSGGSTGTAAGGG